MKIKQHVREKYMELCPYSAHKCESYEELDYKIIRAVETGRVINTYPCRAIQYHNLRFTVKDNTVIDMEKNSEYANVSHYRKRQFEQKYYNISVCEGDYNNNMATDEEIYELLYT
ncbi:hypothetical protein [Paenibacillus sp. FSL H3-0286]|uniref:hypothetical protein n=1 Tax=Paenibacillus sp. FSL H3-0286 TaxID=2921427 RepID=UPI003246388A